LPGAGPARTQVSPSLHSRAPPGSNLPRNTSPFSSVETLSSAQISSSESSPQCQEIMASSMTARAPPSPCPTQLPSKPSALHTSLFSLVMPALTTDFIWGSASTSLALSFRVSATEPMSLDSHSAHSFEAASKVSPAEAVSLCCSCSRPRPCSASRSLKRVPEWILKRSAARSENRWTRGMAMATGHSTSPAFRTAVSPEGNSTSTLPPESSSPPAGGR